MAISVTSVSTAATKAVKSSEDKAEERIGDILASLISRGNADNNHPDIELVELLLNRHTGDNMEKLVAKLGATPASAEEAPKLKGYLPSYEHDGSPTGSGFKSEEDAKAAGFEVWLEADGTQKGWRKPAPKSLTTGDDDNRKVPVWDSRGVPIGTEVTIAEGKVNPVLREEKKDDKIVAFRLLPNHKWRPFRRS